MEKAEKKFPPPKQYYILSKHFCFLFTNIRHRAKMVQIFAFYGNNKHIT